MAKTSRDRAAALIRDIEAHARRLRSDIRKKVAATGVPKNLQAGVTKLRKQIAAAATQLDKHVRQLRKDIGAAGNKRPKRAKRKRAAAR